MGRSPSITLGDAHEGVRVEHIKSKGVLRLTRWSAGTAQDDAFGIEVNDFCARLGITTDILGTSQPQYLLVGNPAGAGAHHLVALFADEKDARAAFVRFRRSEQGPSAWAELSEITPGREPRRICWFGSTSSNGEGPNPGFSGPRPRRVLGLRRRK